MSLLELENVVIAYGKVEALKGVTLRVEQGEIVVRSVRTAPGKALRSAPFLDWFAPGPARCVSLASRSIGSRLR
jgi:ABC-type polar amino acid transport system ATPase subunit